MLKRGDTVILDNLAAHKVAGVERRSRLRAPGSCTSALFPDFNPIEQIFAKLKADLRKAAARTFQT